MSLIPPDDLNPQERAVLQAVEANPFVGQQEVAAALGLARSTVAAHIVSLVQKGYILGRGYVLPEGRRVVCLGGATVDRKYRAGAPVIPGTSNPVDGRRAFGGVARNVAENLARLGLAVSLVSVVGEDETGEAVLRHLREAGVDLTRVSRSRERATAEYVAVLEPDGSLALGLADMGILDLIGPDLVDDAWPYLAAAAWVFADCNLPAPTLDHLLARKTGARFRLAVDAVSTPKVRRLPADLTAVDLLFLNLDEARALAERPDAGPEEAALALCRRGAGAVVLTRGATGVILAEGETVRAIPAVPARQVDATGAGDALVAGTLAGLAEGRPLPEALRTGALVAALTIESEASVHPDLSARLVELALDRLSPVPGGLP